MRFRNIHFIVFFALVVLSRPAFGQDILSEESAVPDTETVEQVQELPSEPSEQKIVKSIEIVGNKTISIATILSKIKTRVGQEYLQNIVSDDLKRLYNTGYFSDVRVDRQDQDSGFKVVIYVDEKPIVEEVTFSKTRAINSKTLKKKIKTQVGKFLDNKTLKDDIDTMKNLYTQKGLSEVEVNPETFVDEVTNKATIHFVVREGFRIRVKRINVYGNDAYRDSKIIRIIKTRAATWYRAGFLKKDILEEDMERVKSFYEQNGYIDVTAENAVEMLRNGYVEVNITVNEGKRYFVGSVNVLGNDVVSIKEILKVMESIKPGNVFSREKLSVDIASIRTLYFDQGYIFAQANDSTSLDSETGKVEVNIKIAEGKVAYVEKVKIQGNERTRDIVIRRELKMYPGDRFDGAKLKRSKEKLDNLGYFEEVNFDIEDTETDDRKDLVVQVKEAKTGTFSFGGGFSTVDKVVGFVEIEQRNFDFTNWPTFTGGGQHLSFRAETGSTRNNLRLSFTEPWIFDHPISGGFDAYRSTRDKSEDTGYAYDETKTGGDIRFGKQFSDINRGSVSYKQEKVKISNIDADVSADLLAEAGENTVSQVSFGLERDTRDSIFNPTKGLVLNGGFDIAGKYLGGDKEFYRFQFGAGYHIPLTFKSVLEMSAKAGFVNDYGDSNKVPIFERFFAGGAQSIRGYDERGVGPLDSVTNDPIGGETMFVANIEYTIPLLDFIKLATFFDTGNVWTNVDDFGSGDFKSGAGLGLRVKTPIGPINLDYGFPLSDEPGKTDRTGKFYFSVSRGF